MTGPDDRLSAAGQLPPRRQLPPELDPRRPAARRPSSSRPSTSAGQALLDTPDDPRVAPAGPPRQPPRRKRGIRGWRDWSKKRWLATVSASMVVVLFITFGVAALVGLSILSKINHINPFCNNCSRPAAGASGDLNILIVGSDSRAGLTSAQKKSLHVGHDAGQRSDTMMLVHIPSGGGKADLVSLPRDSYVTIPAHCSNGDEPSAGRCAKGSVIPAAKNKLNAAYSFGGAALTIATVEYNTHVRIDHYIEINFLGFVNMVNALGGVPVCSSTAINDPVRYSSATSGYIGSGLVLPAGTTKLNGAQALEYVRAREFDPAQGDLGRIKRQQKFMAAMMNKAKSAGVLLDLPKLDSFLNSVASSLTTDKGLGTGTIIRLAKRLHSMSPNNVNLLTVPLSDTNLATPDGSAVKWDPVLSRRLFRDFSLDKPITNVTKPQHLTVAPSDIAVTVLNATPTNGLAATVSSALAKEAFIIHSTGDAPSGSNPKQTVVLYGPSRAESAKTLAAAVPGAILRADSSLGNGVELLVGSSYSGVKAVKISSATNTPSVTTGASNPCS